MTADDDLARTSRMLEREKKARREAEVIAERTTRELYRTVERLEALIASIDAPVLLIKPQVIVMPVVGVLTRDRVLAMAMRLLHACREHRAYAVVIDVTGVPSIEPGALRPLLDVIQAARLVGARALVTGLAQDVAIAVTEEPVATQLETAGDLAAGIALVSGEP